MMELRTDTAYCGRNRYESRTLCQPAEWSGDAGRCVGWDTCDLEWHWRPKGRVCVLPLTIAVTGGIGTGKSTVSTGFAARGAVVIDSDLLAREVVAPGSEGLAAVTHAFGEGVIAQNGSLDRPVLGAIVFSDAQARRRLEGIIHPLVRALFAARRALAPAAAVVVNDIPLLRTPAEAARFHLVIGVGVSDPDERVRRLMGRGHSESDARRRIAAQIGDDERRALSDLWVDNSGDVSALGATLDTLWPRLTGFAAHRRSRTSAAPPASYGPGVTADTGPLRVRLATALDGHPVDAGDDADSGPFLQARGVKMGRHAATEALADIGFPLSGAQKGGDREGPTTTTTTATTVSGKRMTNTMVAYGNADPGRPMTLLVEFSR